MLHTFLRRVFRGRPKMLQAGSIAPDFRVKDHTGTERSLADFAGKRVVLWFYPKADTPG
jgi:thioredoxin-dependent peroxiredoxin